MPSARECLGSLASFLPYTTFTRVQESAIPTLLQCDANIVVAAPTGSGKTALLEVAMLRLFKEHLSLSPELNGAGLKRCEERREGRAVYICPIKALASEKYVLWREKFPTLSVALETGDQEHTRGFDGGLHNITNADIIITTPERWDSITRRWKEGIVWSLVASVALLLLDEVHTVSEERGATLEAVVSRMKAIKASISSRGPRSCATRFVAISGTLPNIEDFAEWLQVEPVGVFLFTSADRPVPLTVRIVSFPSTSNNPFAFDRFLSFKLFGLIRQFSTGKPAIVFCASRSEAVNSALRIVVDVRETAAREGSENRLQPTEEVERLAALANEKQLRGLLLLGIAYHHAAMSMNDRTLVESMFREHYISVICTTTTLALGVNLPAHLVIIKGTTFFKGGRREDLPLSEVAQMGGRAGRPGFDSHGTALVLTTEEKAAIYEPLRHGDSCTTVESRLHQKMIEHVNAEVALRTIHSFSLGVEWIKTTFLWIRLKRCPRHYGILFATKEEESNFNREKFASELMCRMLKELERQGCITICRDGMQSEEKGVQDVDGGDIFNMDDANCIIESTLLGRAMAKRYVLLRTVELFSTEVKQFRSRQSNLLEITGQKATKSQENKTLEELTGAPNVFTIQRLLCMLSRCAEFEDLYLRQGDRKHLNEINKTVRYPLNSGMRGGREVREDWHKVYVLIQAHLEHTQISDFSLRNDFVRLWTSAPRLAHFMVDYAWALNSHSFIKESFLLLRCIEQKMWWDGPILKQLEGVGEGAAKSLLRGGIRSFADALSADPRKLETLCGKNPPFGNELQDRCRELPQYELCFDLCEASEIVRVIITDKPGKGKANECDNKYRMAVIVGDTAADTVLLFRRFTSLDKQNKSLVFTFQVPRGFRGRVVGHIFTEKHLLGSDVSLALNLGEIRAEEREASADKRAKQLREGAQNASLPSSSAVFDTFMRDLRWVEGNSSRRSIVGSPFSLRVRPTHQEKTEEPLVGVFGERHPMDTACFVESSPHAAGAVRDGSSPDAATLSYSCSGVGNIPTHMDDDYMKLVARTSYIASNLTFRRSSPVHSCKRPREDSRMELTAPFQSITSPQIGRHRGNSPISSAGISVMLSRTASPDPPVAPLANTINSRPSARFRFGVQNTVSRRVVPEPPPQFMKGRQLFPVCEPAASSGSYVSFAGAHAYQSQRHALAHEHNFNTLCTNRTPSRVYGHVPHWPTGQVGGVAGRQRTVRDVEQPWHRGGFAESGHSLHGWGHEWISAARNSHVSWGILPTVSGYPTLNETRSSPSVGQFYNVQPAMPVPGSFCSLPNGLRASAAPRSTIVRKGWW